MPTTYELPSYEDGDPNATRMAALPSTIRDQLLLPADTHSSSAIDDPAATQNATLVPAGATGARADRDPLARQSDIEWLHSRFPASEVYYHQALDEFSNFKPYTDDPARSRRELTTLSKAIGIFATLADTKKYLTFLSEDDRANIDAKYAARRAERARSEAEWRARREAERSR